MIECERFKTNPQKMQHKTVQTFFNMRNVYVFDIGSTCIHGKELPENLTFHQTYRKISHNETDVRHIWKVDIRTIRRDLWSEYK